MTKIAMLDGLKPRDFRIVLIEETLEEMGKLEGFDADWFLARIRARGAEIVPKEPSEEMKDAGFKAIFEPESCLSDIEIEDVYRAMIHPTNNEGEK